MLSAMGYATIIIILVLLLTNRVTAVVALAGVPVVTALLAGFSVGEVGEFIATGLGSVVGVTTMFVFAIVYFGLMRDAGLFDPIIGRIVSWAGNAPVTIAVATTALACVAHLDGAGATTFLITIPAMLPLYDRLGMSRLTLSVCVGMGAGVMNIMPWGGPTARAATTIGADANDLWVPLIPSQLVGIVGALAIAWYLGRREHRRLGLGVSSTTSSSTPALSMVGGGSGSAVASGPVGKGPSSDDHAQSNPRDHLELSVEEQELRRPRLYWFNVTLTVLVLGALIAGLASPEMIFLIGVVLALVVNYPGLRRQTTRIEAHATGAMLMATTLLAAGAFLGILGESGMIDAMASSAAGVVPAAVGPALPLIIGVLGVPLSLLFGPDAYYFGVMPVLTALGEQYGVPAEAIAQASMMGQETVGFPISPLTGSFYLLVGLAGVDIGRHIRALFGWAWLLSLLMLATAFITTAIPVWVS